MDRKGKIELAQRIARRRMDDAGVLAILLVGSVATGVESADSDLDIAVFSGDIQEVSQEIGEEAGIRVSIEFHPVQEFMDWPEVPVLDRKSLRNCGRFLRGIVLESRWPDLESVRRKWHSAILHPSEALTILRIPEQVLRRQAQEGLTDRLGKIWSLQGAAFAVAIVALSMAPCRFQKPKWLARDLAVYGPSSLLSALRLLCSLSSTETDEARARQATEVATSSLEEGCGLASLPRLSFDDLVHDQDAVYVYQTYRDALSLLQDGDWEGVVFTSVYSIRLMHALLRRMAKERNIPNRDQLAGWKAQAMESTYGQGALPAWDDVELAARQLSNLAFGAKSDYLKAASSARLSAGQAEMVRRIDGMLRPEGGCQRC